MTLVVGLRGADGVVLASDSQATYGELKQSENKLFKMSYGVIWGSLRSSSSASSTSGRKP